MHRVVGPTDVTGVTGLSLLESWKQEQQPVDMNESSRYVYGTAQRVRYTTSIPGRSIYVHVPVYTGIARRALPPVSVSYIP